MILASETCALDAVAADFVRDVDMGEMVVIDGHGLTSIRFQERGKPSLCIFEFIYFARPDSVLQGLSVHAVRKELGRILARECPAAVDLVVGVPDSGISAAIGYAEVAGLPYELGLIRNRYVGRTFIQPEQQQRTQSALLKLNALRSVVDGKRVVLVDDSVVRGTSSRHIVQLLRRAGAREVHLRIGSPPYRFSCFYGVDTSVQFELIAAQHPVDEIGRIVSADSIGYLSAAGTVQAVRSDGHGYCTACFSGEYVVPVKERSGKHALEDCRQIED